MNYEKWPFNLGSNIFTQLDRQRRRRRCTFVFLFPFFSIMIFSDAIICRSIDRLFSIPFVSIKNRNYFEHSVPFLTLTYVHRIYEFFSPLLEIEHSKRFFLLWVRHARVLARKTYTEQTNEHALTLQMQHVSDRCQSNDFNYGVEVLNCIHTYISECMYCDAKVSGLNSIVVPHICEHTRNRAILSNIDVVPNIYTMPYYTQYINEMTAISITSMWMLNELSERQRECSS